MKSVPIEEIERFIDDLETKSQTEHNISKDFEQAGKLAQAAMHTTKAHAYNYAAGELRKLL